MTRYLNFCSACAVTVVIFGHLNRSFYLLPYILTRPIFPRKTLGNRECEIFTGHMQISDDQSASEHWQQTACITWLITAVLMRQYDRITIWFVTDVASYGDAETDIIFDQLNVVNFHFGTQNTFDRRLNTDTGRYSKHTYIVYHNITPHWKRLLPDPSPPPELPPA